MNGSGLGVLAPLLVDAGEVAVGLAEVRVVLAERRALDPQAFRVAVA